MKKNDSLLADPLQGYLTTLNRTDDPVLTDMHTLAAESGFPIVGPEVGRLLHVWTRSIGARVVFELGSGFGYSAHWFAQAVGPEGAVHLTERSESRLLDAKAFLSRSELWERCIPHCGDALSSLAAFDGLADVIFMDIDKTGYPDAIESVAEHLRVGGLFITDNCLWFGRVYGDDASESTEAIRAFTAALWSDPRFACTLIPLRDGVTVALRIA